MISENYVISLVESQKVLNDFCRFCLSVSNTISVFEIVNKESITEKIINCTALIPRIDDGLPASICEICFKELNAANSFRNKCIHAENILRKIILERKYTALTAEDVNCDYNERKLKSKRTKSEEIPLSEYINFNDGEDQDFSDDFSNGVDGNTDQLENKSDIIKRTIVKSEDIKDSNENSATNTSLCNNKVTSEYYNTHLKRKHNVKRKKKKRDKYFKKESSKNHKTIDKNNLNNVKHEDEDVQNDELSSMAIVMGEGKDKIFLCKSCNYQSKRRNQFRYHVRIHTGELPHVCNICNRAFRQPSSLNYHKKTHNQKDFCCPSCPKIFYCKQHYIRHLRVHSNEKIAKCPICDKALKSNATLKVHMDRHRNIKNYGCEKCGKAFVTMSELIGHSAKHNDEKKYICDICNFRSKKKTGLKNHIVVTHLGGRPFECHFCDMKFNTNGILKSHMRRHTNEKKYQCSICDARFMHSPSLNKHMLNAHDIKFKWSDVIDRRIVK